MLFGEAGAATFGRRVKVDGARAFFGEEAFAFGKSKEEGREDMDIFKSGLLSPMDVKERSKPFDDPKYIYEVKYEGARCLAYLEAGRTKLIDKKCTDITDKFPELSELHTQVSGRCILDGALIIGAGDRGCRKALHRRSGLTHPLMIKLGAKFTPAVFVAFDILYHHDRQITQFPLISRKKLLGGIVRENNRIAVSRYVEGTGEALFEAARAKRLGGILAKKKSAPYLVGETTKDWVKIKNLFEDDFVICGYVPHGRKITCLLLGQYSRGGKLVYKGHVRVNMSRHDTHVITRQKEAGECLLLGDRQVPNAEVIWVMPHLVCTVEYAAINENGILEGAEFVSLRVDKTPYEVMEYASLAFV